MKTLMVLGAQGGVGAALVSKLCRLCEYQVIPIGRAEADLAEPVAEMLLKQHDPDVIINCAGVLYGSYRSIIDVNLGLNHQILEYYLHRMSDHKAVNIVLIGSSAYQGARSRYPVYAASKAALHSLVQSYQELFCNSQFKLSLLHPGKINTAMRANLNCDQCLAPDQVAEKLIELIAKTTIMEYTL